MMMIKAAGKADAAKQQLEKLHQMNKKSHQLKHQKKEEEEKQRKMMKKLCIIIYITNGLRL